eukprot:Rhum_TRINITY_DN14912_c12_g1::Rhum_TRINITY_DN14912_c12_g1_i1::g.128287::m.128287
MCRGNPMRSSHEVDSEAGAAGSPAAAELPAACGVLDGASSSSAPAAAAAPSSAASSQPPSPSGDGTLVRPCGHNDWDDVRQRKGVKVLRCRVCNVSWRWPRGAKRGDKGLERCIEFLNNRCTEPGPNCPLLHIRRFKKSLEDRVRQFGSQVLTGVAQDDRKTNALQSHVSLQMETFAEAWQGNAAGGPSDDDDGDDAGSATFDRKVIEGLARVANEMPQASSGPSTPRGTAAVFHKGGPPRPEGLRRRANTPPIKERALMHTRALCTTSTFVPAELPACQEFAKEQAERYLGMPEGTVTGVHWEVLRLRNNAVGLTPRPRASTASLVFLGSFRTFADCQRAAEEERCFAFVWHAPACPRANWRFQGYGFLVPNHNTCGGDPAEVFDPPPSDGTVTARLLVTGHVRVPTFGCFAAADTLPQDDSASKTEDVAALLDKAARKMFALPKQAAAADAA